MTTNQTERVSDEELEQMIWKLERDGMTPKQLSLMKELRERRKASAEPEARPANPINFKENADADYCRGWAWNEVKKELGTETWTVGDNCTYYGFFCWGWDSRRQYNEQRAAATDKGE